MTINKGKSDIVDIPQNLIEEIKSIEIIVNFGTSEYEILKKKEPKK